MRTSRKFCLKSIECWILWKKTDKKQVNGNKFNEWSDKCRVFFSSVRFSLLPSVKTTKIYIDHGIWKNSILLYTCKTIRYIMMLERVRKKQQVWFEWNEREKSERKIARNFIQLLHAFIMDSFPFLMHLCAEQKRK